MFSRALFRLTTNVSSIELQPSLVLESIPWDILNLICQHSDEKTLWNLCLVSFEMLKFAGPLLFQAVEIKSFARLYSLFVPPSLLPSSSRLRPFLGLHRIRGIEIRLEDTDGRLFKKYFPLPVRQAPFPGLSSSNLDLDFLSLNTASVLPFVGFSLLYTKNIRRFTSPRSELLIFPKFHDGLNPLLTLVSMELSKSKAGPPLRRRTHFTIRRTRLVLQDTAEEIPAVLSSMRDNFNPDHLEQFVTKLDLSAIPRTANRTFVEESTRALLYETPHWRALPGMMAEFLVPSEEWKVVVEEEIEKLAKEEKRSRCRVVVKRP